jgi:hypothetical protein
MKRRLSVVKNILRCVLLCKLVQVTETETYNCLLMENLSPDGSIPTDTPGACQVFALIQLSGRNLQETYVEQKNSPKQVSSGHHQRYCYITFNAERCIGQLLK